MQVFFGLIAGAVPDEDRVLNRYFRPPAGGDRTTMEGEVGPHDFRIQGSGEGVIMLIHGFLETPNSFVYLVEGLRNSTDWSIDAPLLPGHGTRPRDLRRTRWSDWVGAVTRRYERLAERYPRVVVCGNSLGGLLACRLSSRDTLEGLILVAPAFGYRWRIMRWFPETLGKLLPYLPLLGVSGLNDPTLRDEFIHYRWIPMRSVRQITRLQRVVYRENLPFPEGLPVLFLQSENDTVVDPESTRGAAENTSHPGSRARWFTRSNHVLLLDYERQDVRDEVIRFLGERVD